ncbi:MAG: curli production assembly/transport component CsgG [Parcubacteria group bacterium Athens0714_26]|nr:MAG: curli production assembly/transport component CsgG [Parcubacteria group bacterium Athens0714_26]
MRVKRLLEVETGFSTNEPVEMCVLEAVERGVRDLVIEGIVDKIWELENPADFNSSQISEYLKEKEENGGIIVLKKKDEILNEINKKKATELEKTK